MGQGMAQVKFVEDSLQKISLGSFLNTLSLLNHGSLSEKLNTGIAKGKRIINKIYKRRK